MSVSRHRTLRVVSLPTLLGVFSFVAVAGDISGTYEGKNPANGLTVTLNLKSDGSNLSGSILEMPFSNGRVDNDSVSFTVTMPPYKSMQIVSNFTGTVDGDRIHLIWIVVVTDGGNKTKGKPIKLDVTRQSQVSNATPATPAEVANGQSGAGGESKVASSGGASYKVAFATTDAKWIGGTLTVRNFTISYPNGENPGSTAILSCSEVGKIGLPTVDKGPTKFMNNWLLLPKGPLMSKEKDLNRAELYQRVKNTCSTQEAAHLEEQARAGEEEVRRREAEEHHREAEAKFYEEGRARHAADEAAAAARRTKDFHDGILAAVSAAEEPDPFASIRGDFDLAGSDSRQWKTSFRLPDSDRCGLIKTPLASPNSGSAWTLACLFSDVREVSGEGYQRMVKSVQGVLGLPYQPDERATNINQVFFADPTRPRWRMYVTKISGSSFGISVVAVTSTASTVPAFPNATPFSAAPTVPPTEPTVHDEVETIRLEKHGAAPSAQRAATGAFATSGRTTMTVKNSTGYELSVLFDGPVSTKLTLSPGASQDVELAAGAFHVAGRVTAANVLPFYGEESYAGSARYSMNFYISP
jgi:hypothetical protein